MSRKKSKFYVINFIDCQIIFFKKESFNTTCNENAIWILHKEGKSEERRCVQGL